MRCSKLGYIGTILFKVVRLAGPSCNLSTTLSKHVRTKPGDPVDRESLEKRKIVSQNVRGWKASLKKEAVIDLMVQEDISAFCIQETWEQGFSITSIRGYLVIQQNITIETWKKRTDHGQGGIRKGVAIILNPEFAEAFHRAGDKITKLDEANKYSDRFLGINLQFDAVKLNGKKLRAKATNIFLSSVYHPWEPELYDDFNDTITECLSKVPQNSIRIIGHDLNASVGIRTVDDEGTTNDVLGPFGFNNRNEKGLMAIDFLQHNNFRVMTTFF